MTPEELKEAIKEFKVIYKRIFGIDLSDDEASEKAISLLQLFDCITQKVKKGVK